MEYIKRLNVILKEFFELKYNGAFQTANDKLNLDISRGNGRLDYIVEDLYNKLTDTLVKDEVFKEYKELGTLSNRFPNDSSLQYLHAISINGQNLVILVIIKWYCANCYNMEFTIDSLPTDSLIGWALRGILDYHHNINWSKIHCPLTTVPLQGKAVPVLMDNRNIETQKYLEKIKQVNQS